MTVVRQAYKLQGSLAPIEKVALAIVFCKKNNVAKAKPCKAGFVLG